MPRPILVALTLLLLAIPARAGEEILLDGVLHVRNPAQPPGGVETVRLEELWRVGGEDGDLLLGLPTGLDTDAEGRVYVLDAQLEQVHVIGPDGTLLATRSRGGEGPGEMSNPSDLMVWPDGTIGVVQEYPGYVVRLDGEGLPLPRLHPGGATEEGGWGVLMTGKATGRGYVVAGQMSRMGESGEQVRRQYLAAYDLEGNETATFVEQTGERDRSRPPRERDLVLPWALAWDVAPDGRVVVDEAWAAYRLNVYGADGALERVIEVDLPERERRDDDRRFMARLFGVPEGQPLPIELDEHEPAVAILQAGVQVSDAGEIWVLPSRGNRDLPPEVLARFDVFDGAGHFERQVEVICQGDPRNDRLVVLADGRMIRQRRFVDAFVTSLGPGSLPRDARADEGDSPAVICYRVVR